MPDAARREAFAGSMAQIAGRPLAEDALAFLALATHLGAATAAAKSLAAPPPGPAHWESLLAAILVAELPVCRWLRGRILQQPGASLAGFETAGVLPPLPARRAAQAAARSGPAEPGTAGWLTASADEQLRNAARLTAPDMPLGAEHLALSVFLVPAPPHTPVIPGASGTSPQALLEPWRADRLEAFQPGPVDERFDPEGMAGRARDPLLAAALRRMAAGAYDPRGLPIPFLAAVTEPLHDRPATPDGRLAAALHPFVSFERSQGWAEDRGLRTLVARAEALAGLLGETALAPRHVIGAAIAPERPDLPPLAVPLPDPDTGAPPDEAWRGLRTRFLGILAEAEDDPRRLETWADLMLGGRVARVRVASDDPARARDLLEFERHARAIAAVMADREVTPPLAIALFGPWGSGKSTMIALIKAALRMIEDGARAGRRGEFCQGIVTVDFNAWHYAESSLWASLFVRILEALAEHLRETPDAAPGARERAELLIELDAALRDQQAAEAEALRRRAEAAEAERRAGLAGEAAAEAERLAASRAAIAAAEGAAARSAQQAVEDAAREVRRQAADTFEVLAVLAGGSARGLAGEEGAALAAQLDAARATIAGVATEGRTVLGQVRAAWRTLAAGRRASAILLFLGAGALAVLIALAAQAGWFGWALALVTAASSAVAPVVPHWQRFRSVLAEAGRYAAAAQAAAERARGLDEARREAREKAALAERLGAEAIRAAEQAGIARAAAAEAVAAGHRAGEAKVQAEAARQKAAGIQARLAAIAPARLLESFVGERAASGDYAKHLGLPTLIRRDLEGLSAHLAELRKPSDPPAKKPVERIILFIDDLDRCPPEVVVRVLEAVHILLTSDLFEVVVGVDVRWVQRALERHHEGQFGGNGPLDATEYLEKIFQVPFWIPSMGAGGRRAVLDAALPAAAGPVSGTGLPGPGGAAPVAERPRRVGPPEVTATGEKEERPPAAPLPPLDPVALLPEERAALLRWGGLAGDTPRRLKRFARSYLIFRAALSVEERGRFADDRAWDAAAFLLAVGCRFPEHWPIVADAAGWGFDQHPPALDPWPKVPVLRSVHPDVGRGLEQAFGPPDTWPDRRLCADWRDGIGRFGFGRAA